MLVGSVHGIGRGPLLPGSEGARGPSAIFGLGQQVPHRGGGAWRYSPECNDEIYGSCEPQELFGLGELPGGTGNFVATLVGAGLIGASFFVKGDFKEIARGLGIILGGIGLVKMINDMASKVVS